MRVLCIDDEFLNREVVKMMLIAAGAEAVEARSGVEGLTMLDAGPVDAVVLDLRMPDMDGLEVLTRIRARSDIRSQVPVIVASCDMGPQVRNGCMAAGADDVIFKPVAMSQLFCALGNAMAKRALGAPGSLFASPAGASTCWPGSIVSQ